VGCLVTLLQAEVGCLSFISKLSSI